MMIQVHEEEWRWKLLQRGTGGLRMYWRKRKAFLFVFFLFILLCFIHYFFFVLFGPSFSFFGDKLMMDHVLGINVEKISIIKKKKNRKWAQRRSKTGGGDLWRIEGNNPTNTPIETKNKKLEKKERGYMRATVHKNSRSSTYQPPLLYMCIILSICNMEHVSDAVMSCVLFMCVSTWWNSLESNELFLRSCFFFYIPYPF